MFHLLKWTNLHTRMLFEGEGAGAGAASPASATSSSGDGGGGSSVAPTPSGGEAQVPQSEPSSPSDSPSGDEVSPWAQLGEPDVPDDDSVTIPPAPPAAAEPSAPVVVPPVTPPAATPPVAQATPPTTPPGQTPNPTSSPPAEAVPQLSPSDPVGVATALEANRDAVIAHLAQTRFALSEADIAELETDAAAAVPKLLARAMYETQTTMYKFLAQAVPGMIQRHTKVSSANDEAETKFFDTHKGLGLDPKNKAHRDTATRIATIYRRANPNIPLEQLIQEVGPMVATALSLRPMQQQPAPQAPRAPGFRPAVDGGGGFSPAPAPADEWGALGQSFEE